MIAQTRKANFIGFTKELAKAAKSDATDESCKLYAKLLEAFNKLLEDSSEEEKIFLTSEYRKKV